MYEQLKLTALANLPKSEPLSHVIDLVFREKSDLHHLNSRILALLAVY